MAEEKPRLARLTAIITQLQSRRMVTARELASKYNVSIRTIYRDIRTLEQSGIPIVTEEGKGYFIMEGFMLPPVMFSEDEVNALITAEKLVKKNTDQSLIDNYENAITKLKSIFKYDQKTKTELLSQRLHVRNNIENKKTSNYLIRLQTAISNYRVVKIDYLSLDNKPSKRNIEPFALYTTNDNWIIIAFCRERHDFRAFRLDCIQHLTTTELKFEPHNITLEQYLEKCRKKYIPTPDTPMTQP